MNDTANIKRQFFDSMKRGAGEAFLIAKENPKIDFSTYVIKGAIRNYAYDGQPESKRAQYIFDLYSLSDKKDKIGKAILNGIATEQVDTWSLTHLFDLAKLFSRFKNKEGKWGIPINMGDKINTQEWERFPVVSPDGRFF